jgi:hypothetical protein
MKPSSFLLYRQVQIRMGAQDKALTLGEASVLSERELSACCIRSGCFTVDVRRDRALSIKFRLSKLNSA